MARQYKTGLIITGDAKGGIRAIQATEKELGQLNKGFERSTRRSREFSRQNEGLARELGFLKRSAMGVGAALAGAFAVNSLAGQARMIAETDALAQSIGVATGELQAWDYAAQQVGLGAGKIGDIFKDVSDKLGDFVATGGGEAADLFENLNLDIEALRRLSPDQQLLKIGEALSQIDDPSQRVFYLESIANDASRLLPLLEDNAAGLREAAAEARALGVAMDQVDIDNARQANDALIQLRGTLEGLTNEVVADLGPGLAEATDALTDFIQEAGGAAEVLETATQVAGTLGAVYLARRLGPGLRTVGARGLTAGANIAQGMAIAMGATGRLNQALVVTQGRIAATAAAGRGLSAALGLVGGPMGAAILAGGAIYYFRDELGLTQEQLGLTEEQLADLRGELNDMSREDLGASIKALSRDLEEATLKAAIAREELAQLRSDERGSGFLGFGAGEVGEEVRGMQAVSEAERRIREIEQRLTETRQEQGSRDFRSLDGWLFDVDPGASRRSVAGGGAQAEAAQEAERQARQLADSYQSIVDRIRPLQAAQRQYAEEKATLVEYALRENMAAAELQRLLGDLENSYRSSKSVAEAYGESGRQATQEVSRGAQDLGFAFSSAFESAVVEGEALRGVLAGIAEDIARITLRETVTSPIAGVLSSAIGGVFGGSSIAGGFTSQVDTGAAFAGGGYTGPGPRHQAAGVVHAGEFVVKKSVVDRPGVRPALERLNRGYAEGGYVAPPGLSAMSPPSAGQGGAGITIHAPITVQAAPGMRDEDAQRQGRQMGRAFETEVLRVLQKQQRPGGILSKGNSS